MIAVLQEIARITATALAWFVALDNRRTAETVAARGIRNMDYPQPPSADTTRPMRALRPFQPVPAATARRTPAQGATAAPQSAPATAPPVNEYDAPTHTWKAGEHDGE